MNSVERVKAICKERKIPISKLENDLTFSNGYIGQLRKGVFPADRLVKIANYLDVSVDYLLTGEEKKPISVVEMNIAQNLKKLMVQHRLSSSKLARELHVHTSTISNWLNGKDVRVENLSALCDYFGCSLDYLVGNDAGKKSTQEDELNQQPELDDEQLKVAYFRGADPSLTKEDLDAMWEDAKNFRDFILEKKRREKHGE